LLRALSALGGSLASLACTSLQQCGAWRLTTRLPSTGWWRPPDTTS